MSIDSKMSSSIETSCTRVESKCVALQTAVEAVKTGKMSYRKTAAAYGVPRNTIYSHVHQVVTQSFTVTRVFSVI